MFKKYATLILLALVMVLSLLSCSPAVFFIPHSWGGGVHRPILTPL